MSSDIVLRRAKAEDLNSVHKVRRRAILGMDCEWFAIADRRDWAMRREAMHWMPAIKQRLIVIAEMEGLLIAWGSSEGDAVTGMYTEPTHCRKGIGRRLIASLESDIRCRGHSVAAVVASSNAVGFYSRVGYVPTEPIRKDGPTTMIKRLTPGVGN